MIVRLRRQVGICGSLMVASLLATPATWAQAPSQPDYNTPPAASPPGQVGTVPYRMPSADTISKAEEKKPFDWFGLRKSKEAEINPSQFPFARLCERRGDLVQARRIYETLRDKDPNNQAYHHRLAILSAREGKVAEADHHFHRAFETGAATPDLLSDYGYFLYLQHRLPDAERVLRDALSQEPQHQSALNNLGLTLGQMGRFEEALAVFRQGGSDAEAHNKLAYVYSVLGIYDRALTHYSHALSLDPSMRHAAEAMLQVDRKRMAAEQMQAQAMAQAGGMPPTAAQGLPPQAAPAQGMPMQGMPPAYMAGGQPSQFPAAQPQPFPGPQSGPTEIPLTGQAYSPSAAAMHPSQQYPAAQPTAMPSGVSGYGVPSGVVPASAVEGSHYGAMPQQSAVVPAPFHVPQGLDAAGQPSLGGPSMPSYPSAAPAAPLPQQPAGAGTARITNVRPRQ